MTPAYRTTYAVRVRKDGTANKWIDWRPACDSLEEAIRHLHEAMEYKGEVKIVRCVNYAGRENKPLVEVL